MPQQLDEWLCNRIRDKFLEGVRRFWGVEAVNLLYEKVKRLEPGLTDEVIAEKLEIDKASLTRGRQFGQCSLESILLMANRTETRLDELPRIKSIAKQSFAGWWLVLNYLNELLSVATEKLREGKLRAEVGYEHDKASLIKWLYESARTECILNEKVIFSLLDFMLLVFLFRDRDLFLKWQLEVTKLRSVGNDFSLANSISQEIWKQGLLEKKLSYFEYPGNLTDSLRRVQTAFANEFIAFEESLFWNEVTKH